MNVNDEAGKVMLFVVAFGAPSVRIECAPIVAQTVSLRR